MPQRFGRNFYRTEFIYGKVQFPNFNLLIFLRLEMSESGSDLLVRVGLFPVGAFQLRRQLPYLRRSCIFQLILFTTNHKKTIIKKKQILNYSLRVGPSVM